MFCGLSRLLRQTLCSHLEHYGHQSTSSGSQCLRIQGTAVHRGSHGHRLLDKVVGSHINTGLISSNYTKTEATDGGEIVVVI